MRVIKDYDVVIVGTGIAGLSVAKALNGSTKTCVLTKGKIPDSATAWAQGGIACVVQEDDSWESHLNDTLSAGHGLCDPDAVRLLVQEGPQYVQELIGLGAQFDKSGEGFDLAREGAHSYHRVLHAGDQTGHEIEKTLGRHVMRCDWVTFYEQTMVYELVVHNDRCIGCLALVDGECVFFQTRHLVLATGGAARVYSRNTVPRVATGDGVALGYLAGAAVCDLEFFQFHPTAFYQ